MTSFDYSLFARFLIDAPFQPATNYWRTIEIATLKPEHFPNGNGLDLGCGDGRLTRIVTDRIGKRNLVGLDADPAETLLAANEGIYSRVHTAQADRIPELDASFDFVFSNSVLEHIKEIDSVLKEVGRILKPGGRFVFTVPSDGFHSCLRGPILPGSKRESYLNTIDLRCAHLRYWGIEEWREHLLSVGMDVVISEPYLSKAQVLRWETLSRFTAGLLFMLFRKRHHPIEIQRRLGMRKDSVRMFPWMAVVLSRILSAVVFNKNSHGKFGCLLIIAEKKND